MGMTDFYIVIFTDSQRCDQIYTDFIKAKYSNVFSLTKTRNQDGLEAECIFDNLIITAQIIYDLLNRNHCNASNTKIETFFNILDFDFHSQSDFLNFLYNIHYNRIMDYYKNLGYFYFNKKSYHLNRNKRKYSKFFNKYTEPE